MMLLQRSFVYRVVTFKIKIMDSNLVLEFVFKSNDEVKFRASYMVSMPEERVNGIMYGRELIKSRFFYDADGSKVIFPMPWRDMIHSMDIINEVVKSLG